VHEHRAVQRSGRRYRARRSRGGSRRTTGSYDGSRRRTCPGRPELAGAGDLCAFGLDRRLTALAARFGATYSRYADDLVLSGGPLLRRAADTAAAAVADIARDEGFHVNEAKRRMATRAGRQRVCGIVVNERPNLARDEYDRLKAVLHDAARQGPALANRARVADLRAHIQGRVAWLESLNPARGARLRERLDAIAWDC
jgi:RNA-directed DNA polymerase